MGLFLEKDALVVKNCVKIGMAMIYPHDEREGLTYGQTSSRIAVLREERSMTSCELFWLIGKVSSSAKGDDRGGVGTLPWFVPSGVFAMPPRLILEGTNPSKGCPR